MLDFLPKQKMIPMWDSDPPGSDTQVKELYKIKLKKILHNLHL